MCFIFHDYKLVKIDPRFTGSFFWREESEDFSRFYYVCKKCNKAKTKIVRGYWTLEDFNEQ
jgi:hypothetical protein